MPEKEKENEDKKKQPNLLNTTIKKLKANPWKTAFIILVGVLVGLSLVLFYRISTPRMTYSDSTKEVAIQDEPLLDINMKKEQVNEAINFFLKDMMEESGVDYTFVLENQALVEGTFSLLGHDTHFYLYFEPYVLSNGNIQLKAKSLSIGSLNLPISAVINYISSTVDLPDWVEIDSDQQLINLHLNKFKLENGMSIRAKKINLIDDDISFSLYLPEEEE